MKYLSICIPTYEMKGLGADFLRFSFIILTKQSFKDFDIVISDHSTSDVIKSVCEEFKDSLDIHYIRNSEKRGNSPANTNNAIRHATGKLIKILFQDDFLKHKRSLEDIVTAFDSTQDHWLVTACEHTTDGKTFFQPFYPHYNDLIYLGKNTISSPSVLTILNKNPLYFDEKLVWSMDCDYYKQCFDAFGEPKILNSINVVNRVGPHQISNTALDLKLKEQEYGYILKKYKVKYAKILLLKRRIRRYLIYIHRLFKKT